MFGTKIKKVDKNVKSGEQESGFVHPIGGQRNSGQRSEYLDKQRESLAARLAEGNYEAAAKLVEIYYRQIYWFMRRLGHSSHVSEDLTQEIFMSAWQHIGQLRGVEALNSWLYRIAVNVSRQYWRRCKLRKTVGMEGIDFAASDESQIEAAVGEEEVGQLREAVVRLPMKLKQAVVLHYMQHLTIAESAEAAEVRPGTLKSRLSRALKALRKQIDAGK